MSRDDIPLHLRAAALYAEVAAAGRKCFVPRRLYGQVKEYLAWKESRTRLGEVTTRRLPVTSHSGTALPPPRL